MTEAKWLGGTQPRELVEFVRRRPSIRRGDRKLRLYIVACCRRRAEITDPRGLRAIAVAEQFADGEVDSKELATSAKEARRIPNTWGDAVHYKAACAASVQPGYGAYYGSELGHCAGECDLLRDIFGNPFRPVAFDAAWRTSTVTALARGMYESRDFGAMPILADALQDAGCDSDDILDHCRGPGPHVRGCWVVDLVLGKE
jgi:hypothetical protein